MIDERGRRIDCDQSVAERVFDIDLQHCPNCGGELKIIAAIIDAPVIERILTHLGLAARASPRSAARPLDPPLKQCDHPLGNAASQLAKPVTYRVRVDEVQVLQVWHVACNGPRGPGR